MDEVNRKLWLECLTESRKELRRIHTLIDIAPNRSFQGILEQLAENMEERIELLTVGWKEKTDEALPEETDVPTSAFFKDGMIRQVTAEWGQLSRIQKLWKAEEDEKWKKWLLYLYFGIQKDIQIRVFLILQEMNGSESDGLKRPNGY